VAIARVVGATTIYTNDAQLAVHAKDTGIQAITLDDLAEPPVVPQLEMQLEPIEAETTDLDDSEGDAS
jgi:hypothetical protein